MFDLGRSTFNVEDASVFLASEFSRETMRMCVRLLLLSALQFSCTFRKLLLRSGEPGIERERLPEESNGTLVLIECSKIPSTIDQHGGVDRQHLEVYYVIFVEPEGAVSQTTGLQAHVRQVVKTRVAREVENESLRNKLIVLSDPPGQFPTSCVGQ